MLKSNLKHQISLAGLSAFTLIIQACNAPLSKVGLAWSPTQTAASTTSSTTSNLISQSFFGMEENNTARGIVAAPMITLSYQTMRLTDAPAFWGILNPSSGVYDWTALDTAIDATLASNPNEDFLYTFIGTPNWTLAHNLHIVSMTRTAKVSMPQPSTSVLAPGYLLTVEFSSPHGMSYNPIGWAKYQEGPSIRITAPTGAPALDWAGVHLIMAADAPSATSLTLFQPSTDDLPLGAISSSYLASSLADEDCTGVNAFPSCSEAPLDLGTWDAFVTAIATHVVTKYGKGRIKYWEMWNEINNPHAFWKGTVPQMVTMTEHANQILKSIDPSALIVSPSVTILYPMGFTDATQTIAQAETACLAMDHRCGSEWLEKYFAAGGGKYIDRIAVHGYASYGSQINNYMKLLSGYAIHPYQLDSLPILDTEAAWGNVPTTSNWTAPIAWLGQHYLTELSLGFEKSFWYTYNNSVFGTLYNNNATIIGTTSNALTPAGVAYQQLFNWVNGAALTGCTTDATTHIQDCTYTRANGYVAHTLFTETPNKTYSYPVLANFIQYRDLLGNKTTLHDVVVNVTNEPILVETGNPN